METFKIQRKFYKGFDTIYHRIVQKTMLIIKDSEKKSGTETLNNQC